MVIVPIVLRDVLSSGIDAVVRKYTIIYIDGKTRYKTETCGSYLFFLS